jgi:hypothetical protein
MTAAIAFLALLGLSAGIIWLAARRSGSNAVKLETANALNDAAKRINDAQANAPVSRDDLVQRLRNEGL